MKANLVELAQETSSDKRRELLQEISNLFVDGAQDHSDRETMLFGDVLGRLLDQVPVEDRAELSNKVAALDQTPRDLALKLANDEIQVAAPILQHSPALTESDLVELASVKSQGHLQAISMRAELTSLVTDVIIDRGDSAVLNTVARNLGARFSDTGFAKMADKAGADENLGDALSYRQDIPPAVAQGLVARLNPVARKRLEFMLARDRNKLDTLVDSARKEIDNSRLEQRRNRLESKVIVSDVRDGRRRLDDALGELVALNRIVDIGHVLAELASVPESHVNNVMHKVNGIGIAIVCRCLDVSDVTYRALSQMRADRLKLNNAQVDAMVREYHGLDKATAERTLRFHKVRTSAVVRAG